MSKVGVGADGQVKEPVPKDISMIPLMVPESIAVKSTVAPSPYTLVGEWKNATQQKTLTSVPKSELPSNRLTMRLVAPLDPAALSYSTKASQGPSWQTGAVVLKRISRMSPALSVSAVAFGVTAAMTTPIKRKWRSEGAFLKYDCLISFLLEPQPAYHGCTVAVCSLLFKAA